MSDVTVEAAQKALTHEEIEVFARDWYRKLDIHAPLEELTAMVAVDGMWYWVDGPAGGDGPKLVSVPPLEFLSPSSPGSGSAPPLKFVLPEGTISGTEGFQGWYEGVTRIFFDEVHTLTRVEISRREERQAHVKVGVNWQAWRWNPPAPRSEWIGFDVDQDWVLVRSAETGRPVILRYAVNEMLPMPGSPLL